VKKVYENVDKRKFINILALTTQFVNIINIVFHRL